MKRRSRPSLMARLFWWGLHLATLFFVYLLFVGELSWIELLAAAVFASLGLLAWGVVKDQPLARLIGDPRSFGQGWRLVGSAFSGSFVVMRVLFRQLLGGKRAESILRAVPYAHCGDDARASTRRALAVAYTSITPEFIVLDIDLESERMLFHQINRGELAELTRRLGAGE